MALLYLPYISVISPLYLPYISQVALLGDQHQLPPTTVARHPEALAASTPLFTRLLTEGVPALLLDTQYRMHPAIAQLPADLFYAGKISSGVSAEQRPPAPGFQWPQPSWPVALLPVYTGGEASDGLSKVNRAEVDAVAAVVQGLCAAGLSAT